MRDRQADPGERHEESTQSESAATFRRAERDEVYDASLDSFPASDPPSWAGMRVGAPAQDPRASSRDRSSALGERPPPADEPDAGVAESSLASQWTDVHVCHVEAQNRISAGRTGPTVLRAVVQLGSLAPADVRVTVRQPIVDAAASREPPVRLWSAQSYRNGSFVFEASANASEIVDGADLLVSVEPSRAQHGGVALEPVVTEFTRGVLADDAPCVHARQAASLAELRQKDLSAEVAR